MEIKYDSTWGCWCFKEVVGGLLEWECGNI
jgi:hypothetical protein